MGSKVCYLRSLDAVVGDSLIWLGHNSFFLQLAGKRIMFDPVFGSIPFVKRQSRFPNPDIFTGIDYLLVSHDHFDHLDKQSIARLLKNNPQMKLFWAWEPVNWFRDGFPKWKWLKPDGINKWKMRIEDYFSTGTTLEQTFRTWWWPATVGSFHAARKWGFLFIIAVIQVIPVTSWDSRSVPGTGLCFVRHRGIQTSLVYASQSYIAIRIIDCRRRNACRSYHSHALWHIRFVWRAFAWSPKVFCNRG